MGNKINPIGFRLGITQDWKSKWFSKKKEYRVNLRQDIEIRQEVSKKWKAALISEVEIVRSAKMIKVIIKTARPGVLIGRGGSGIEEVKSYIHTKFFNKSRTTNLKVEVQEVKRFEESASIIAQNIVEQLEKRMPFRRAMKTALEQVMKNKGMRGMKIEMSGRLGGAEMSRTEKASKGSVPLHTMRADIDFSRATAFTTYGTLGVKVWLYKGEVFKNDTN